MKSFANSTRGRQPT